ncbi:hypothetical protein GCM10027514_45400 [Azotobacter armeniacus]
MPLFQQFRRLPGKVGEDDCRQLALDAPQLASPSRIRPAFEVVDLLARANSPRSRANRVDLPGHRWRPVRPTFWPACRVSSAPVTSAWLERLEEPSGNDHDALQTLRAEALAD